MYDYLGGYSATVDFFVIWWRRYLPEANDSSGSLISCEYIPIVTIASAGTKTLKNKLC
jgi:hypothetical protein